MASGHAPEGSRKVFEEKSVTGRFRRALNHGKVIAQSMQQLPYIDEHSQQIEAPVDAVWTALLKVLHQMNGGAPLARILGCDPVQGTAGFAGRPGEAVPGFRVLETEHGRRLVLRGRHRFSNYELTFVFDGHRLRAQTHAAYPGVLGRIYRAAVIGSGVHRLVMRRLLRKVARAITRQS